MLFFRLGSAKNTAVSSFVGSPIAFSVMKSTSNSFRVSADLHVQSEAFLARDLSNNELVVMKQASGWYRVFGSFPC